MSDDVGDGLTFDPESYDEGSAELSEAERHLRGAAGASAGMQGAAGDALRAWPPTSEVGDAVDNIQATADQVLGQTGQVTGQGSAELLASKETLAGTDARLSDRIGQIRAGRTSADSGSADPSQEEWKLAQRIEELKTDGPGSHGPQHHLEVSDIQLTRRLGRAVLDRRGKPVLKANGFVRSVGHIDPMTGTTTDAISGLPHRSGSIASRFDSAADFVHADNVLRARARATGLGLQNASIAELFGPEGHTRMTGFYLDPDHPGIFHPVNFEGGFVSAIYEFDRDERPFLITMYPQAARGMHP